MTFFGNADVIGSFRFLCEAQAARDYLFESMSDLRRERNSRDRFNQNDTNISDILNEAIAEARQTWNATSVGQLVDERNIL